MESKVETVRQIYAEFGKGNPQGVLNFLTDDVTWTDPGYPEIPYAGKRKGKDEVISFFVEMGKAIVFTNFEPQLFLNDGSTVIVKGFFNGKSNSTGKTFESEWIMLWEFVNGKVANYQAFIDTLKVASALK